MSSDTSLERRTFSKSVDSARSCHWAAAAARTRSDWRRKHVTSQDTCCPSIAPRQADNETLERGVAVYLHEWKALLKRAATAASDGRPHVSIALCERVLFSSRPDSSPPPSLRTEATRMLRSLLKAQKGVLSRLLPDAGEERASAASESTQVSSGHGPAVRPCVLRADTALLLFREGVPYTVTPRADTGYKSAPALPPTTKRMEVPSAIAPGVAPLGSFCWRDAAGRERSLAALAAQQAVVVRNGHRVGQGGKAEGKRTSRTRTGAQRAGVARADVHRSNAADFDRASAHRALAAAAPRWSGDFLAQQMGDAPCHVLSAPASAARFTYYWGGPSDAVHSHFSTSRACTSSVSSFSSFLAALASPTERTRTDSAKYLQTGSAKYLQTALARRKAARADGGAADSAAEAVELAPIPGALLRAEMQALARRLLDAGRGAIDGGCGAEGGDGDALSDGSARGSAADDDEPACARESPCGTGEHRAGRFCGGSSCDDCLCDDEASSDRDDAACDDAVAQLIRAGRLGNWMRSTLFASTPGSVSRLHYDHYDNIYLQVTGHKRVLLIAPEYSKSLYAFPVHHPLDQRSRVHLDALLPLSGSVASVRGSAFRRLREALVLEVLLGPGDALFIPHHWWHHVETLGGHDAQDCTPCARAATCAGAQPHTAAHGRRDQESLEAASSQHAKGGNPLSSSEREKPELVISLNLWFDFVPMLVAPKRPLIPSFALELARHVEFYVGSFIEPKFICRFFESCLCELGATDSAEAEVAADRANGSSLVLPRPWLLLRNLLFAELAVSWLGWLRLRPFFEDLLHPRRFHGLTEFEPEMYGMSAGNGS